MAEIEDEWFDPPISTPKIGKIPEGHSLLTTYTASNIGHLPFRNQYAHGNYHFNITRNDTGQIYIVAEMPPYDANVGLRIYGHQSEGHAEEYCKTYSKLCSDYVGGSLTQTYQDTESERWCALIKIDGVKLTEIPDGLQGYLFNDYCYDNHTLPEIATYLRSNSGLLKFIQDPYAAHIKTVKKLLMDAPSSSFSDAVDKFRNVLSPSMADGFTRKQNYNDPQMAEEIAIIQKKLHEQGFSAISFLGTGATVEAFTAQNQEGSKVAVCLRKGAESLPKRAPIPQYLQPVWSYQGKSIAAEILPMLDVHSITLNDIAKTDASIAHHISPDSQRYIVIDSENHNYGRSHSGNVYYLDSNGIVKNSQPLPALQGYNTSKKSPYVNQDGKWTQYDDFQSLHESFNSPLHRKGGSLDGLGEKKYTSGQQARESFARNPRKPMDFLQRSDFQR